MATKNAEVNTNEKIEAISSGAMTKAGRLAMELANEKKRLNQELKELQAEYDEVKPTTPYSYKGLVCKMAFNDISGFRSFFN